MKTLLVDPDNRDRSWISRHLSASGYEVSAAKNGITAMEEIEKHSYSLIVTEWLLGDMTGLELAQMVKRSPMSRWSRVLMVSRRKEARHIAAALEGGVDDYVAMPCQAEELVARANAVLRRPAAPVLDGLLTVGPVTLDRAGHKVAVSGSEIELAPVEFRLMAFFMENPGRVMARQQLLDQVWKRRNGIGERTVDVHVRRLRAALEPHCCDHLLQTVRGFGYRFG